VDALEAYAKPKAFALFEKFKVLAHDELHSRYDIYLEQYAKQINIEGLTAVQMVRRQYLPAAIDFATMLASSISTVESAGGSVKVQKALLAKVSGSLEAIDSKVSALDAALSAAGAVADTKARAQAFRDKVFSSILGLRAEVDALEAIVPTDMWPVPTYSELLYRI
jgi:glutamine synthetase